MCKHIYTESIEKSYYDHNLQCKAERRVRTCIFCGKTDKETVYMKDPPKRKLPKFIMHDLSDQVVLFYVRALTTLKAMGPGMERRKKLWKTSIESQNYGGNTYGKISI